MSLQKQMKLMDLLYERTERGLLEWQETLPEIFQVSFTDKSVQLRMDVDELHEAVTYIALLVNDEGQTVDRITDEDLDREQSGTTGAYWYSRLASLFAMARRRARGADKMLDEILKEIEDDIPF